MSTNLHERDMNTGRNARAFDKFSPDLEKSRPKTVALRLPPPGTMRWGVRSKAAVVAAIRAGMLSLEDACQRYALSTTEYLTWEHGLDAAGLEGLGMAGRQEQRRGFTYTRK